MDTLRIYLFSGLILHKAFWEFMKVRHSARFAPKPPQPFEIKLVKAMKVGILLAIVLQTLVPSDVLPIAGDPAGLRLAGTLLYTAGLSIAILGRAQLGRSWS